MKKKAIEDKVRERGVQTVRVLRGHHRELAFSPKEIEMVLRNVMT